jgi:hypothetical protein
MDPIKTAGQARSFVNLFDDGPVFLALDKLCYSGSLMAASVKTPSC